MEELQLIKKFSLLPFKILKARAKDILFDGRFDINLIIKEEQIQLELFQVKLATYQLQMADHGLIDPIEFIQNI